jgi:hypothetical protein
MEWAKKEIKKSESWLKRTVWVQTFGLSFNFTRVRT